MRKVEERDQSSGRQGKVKQRFRVRSKTLLFCVLSVLLILLSIPAAAFAKAERSGWEEVRRYAGQVMQGDPAAMEGYLQSLDSAEKEAGRELTLEETVARKKCIDAQVVYDRTWRVGVEPSDEDLTVLSAAGEAAAAADKEVLAEAEAAMREMYVETPPVPEQQPITDGVYRYNGTNAQKWKRMEQW